MGAWGEGPFSNDDAADFLDGLSDLDGGQARNAVLRALQLPHEEYIEAPEACVAIAAAALVAMQRGYEPPEGGELAADVQVAADASLASRAAQALDRVQGDGSEWVEVWVEAGELEEASRVLADISRHLALPIADEIAGGETDLPEFQKAPAREAVSGWGEDVQTEFASEEATAAVRRRAFWRGVALGAGVTLAVAVTAGVGVLVFLNAQYVRAQLAVVERALEQIATGDPLDGALVCAEPDELVSALTQDPSVLPIGDFEVVRTVETPEGTPGSRWDVEVQINGRRWIAQTWDEDAGPMAGLCALEQH